MTHHQAVHTPTLGHRLRPLLVPALFTLIAGAFLMSLGIWQVHRLAWKENLLATIDQRTRAIPEPPPPPGAWSTLKPADYEYRRVALTGTLDNGKETLVFGSTPYGVGSYVMTPMHLRCWPPTTAWLTSRPSPSTRTRHRTPAVGQGAGQR